MSRQIYIFCTLGISILIASGCTGLKLNNFRGPIVAPDAMSRAVANLEKAEVSVAVPLVSDWVYNAGGAFGAAAPLVAGKYLLAGTRRGDIHAVSIESGKRAGVENYGTAIDGSPAIFNHNVVIPIGWGNKKGLVVHNLDRGSTKWTKKMPPVETDILHFDGTLYLVDHTSVVRSIDAETGDENWIHELDPLVPVRSSPIELTDATIGVIDAAGLLTSVDKNTGKAVWSINVGEPVYANIESDGIHTFVSSTRGHVFAVRNESGSLDWNVQLGHENVRVVTASVFADFLVVGTSAGRVVTLERSSGQLVWETSLGEAVATKPLVTQDYIFVSTMDRLLRALTRADGSEVWSTELKGRAKSEMVALDNQIIVATEPRLIYHFVFDEGGVASAK